MTDNYHYGYKIASSTRNLLNYNNCDSLIKLKIRGQPKNNIKTQYFSYYKTEEAEVEEIKELFTDRGLEEAYSCGVFDKFKLAYIKNKTTKTTNTYINPNNHDIIIKSGINYCLSLDEAMNFYNYMKNQDRLKIY